MDEIKYDLLFNDLQKLGNNNQLVLLIKNLFNTLDNKQLDEWADKTYESIVKQLTTYSNNKGLDVNNVLNYFENDINNGLPETIIKEIDSYSETLNILLNEVETAMNNNDISKDKVVEEIPKEENIKEETKTKEQNDFEKKLAALNFGNKDEPLFDFKDDDKSQDYM